MQLQQQFELPSHSHSGLKSTVVNRKSKKERRKEINKKLDELIFEYNGLVKKSKNEKLTQDELNHAKELMTKMRELGLFSKLVKM